MHAELKWPIGKRLEGVTKEAHSWFFTFSGGGTILTESVWRIVTAKGIVAASEDHGHLFDLPAPVDSSVRALSIIGGKTVLDLFIAEPTSDLTLKFEERIRVEFLNLSGGYESWRAQHGAGEIICMGGGRLAVFADEEKG